MNKANKKETINWLLSITVAVVFVIAIRSFIFSPTVVEGSSMMPTYENGDKLIVNKLNKNMSNINRFDVIIFEAPIGDNYIKRVIGLPGDHIVYEDDILYINGEAFEEPYLDEYKEQLQDPAPLTYDFTLQALTKHEIIPDGYLFVLGDNRRKTADSRDARVGLVPIEKVIGTAHFRIYPFKRLGNVN